MTRHLLAPLLLLVLFTSLAASQVIAQQRVRAAESVMAARLVTKVAPVYPALARIQGTVILRVVINKSGDVENIQLVSGHPMLAPAAIEAVKQWKYNPYLLHGETFAVETDVRVNFTLSEKPPAEGVVGDAPGGIPPDEKGGIVSSAPREEGRPGIPQRVRASQGVISSFIVTKVPPEYPQGKGQRIQGAVVMRVNIDKEGNVSNIQIISGHPLLIPAAIEAVKQWKYKSYLRNGMPVEVETQVTVNFTLVN
jgi:TonB family protein